MRRFTRLTNAFSKKVENHAHAVALYFMYYNFARVHQTLRVTPAMEAESRITSGRLRKLSACSPNAMKSATSEHEHWMRQAFVESQKALPACAPNPPVGCVIVSEVDYLRAVIHARQANHTPRQWPFRTCSFRQWRGRVCHPGAVLVRWSHSIMREGASDLRRQSRLRGYRRSTSTQSRQRA